MADNQVREDASAGGFNHVEPAYGAPAENAGDSVDQMDPAVPSNGGKDDMFVDCPDEIENSDSQQSSEEKHNLQSDQDNDADSGINVQELMAEIELLRDKLEKSASDNERLTRENEVDKVRELQSVLSTKDQEIDYLNAKIAELSESSNIAQSNYQLYELQLEKDQHIEESTNRTLASLFMVHNHEELLDGSLEEKISNVEKSVTFLVEKYNHFISESDQLKECLNEAGLNLNTIDKNGAFVMARDIILELRRKEENLYQSLSNLEDENRKLVEQLEKQRSIAENVNAEIGRLSAEVEHEKNRYANTKEKLSMAVTKGKSLVQHRDSLKQMLAEKTSELEKCSVELQEKSIALEAAEKTKDLVVASEKFAASLQESLAEKDAMLKKCEEILSESAATNELQPTDITDKLRWLADENKSLKAISLQYHKLTDALTSFDFPETVASSELDVLVCWLAESYYMSKEEAMKFQSEIDNTKEAAYGEIDHLTTSLSAEIQEKSYLQAELDDLRKKYEAHERLQRELTEDREAVNNEINRLKTSLLAESQEKNNLQSELENLRHKYEGVVQKEYLVSLEKDKIVNSLMEAFGLANGVHKEAYPEHSDLTAIIDNCLSKIKENICRVESPQVDIEIAESLKSHLYIRDQEMSLYKLIVEEDIFDRAQLSCLSYELETKTQELNALKDENAVMRKSRGQLEDRCALLKDKLSMAVKKGKGLVQERENLKSSLDEKNSEIDRLKSELQESISKYSECQDQITMLSLDVERVSLLETDCFTAKEQINQLEQFLAESNSMLQRVMESIEGIAIPADLSFKDPVEKLKWVAQYLSEIESLKMEMEQELTKVKDEASFLASKLSEVQTSMKTMDEAMSNAETSRSELLDEKKELEVSKTLLEEQLQKEKEKASSQSSELDKLYVSKRALEDALSLAEDNISRFVDERDVAIESRDFSEEQLQKLKEEFYNQITKLADADKTIQSLEDTLSQAQKNITLLAEENSKIQVSTADSDIEMKKIREEADSHASKLSEASVAIKSLEDALLNAENNTADLVREKRAAEEEIVALKATLESHMEELAGTRGSLENRSLELSGQLSRLHLLLEDETLSSLLGQCFDRKFESLNSLNFLVKEIADSFGEIDSDVLQNIPVMEDDSSLSNTLLSNPDTDFNIEMPNDKVNAVDSESLLFQIEKMNERFHLKSKTLADKIDNLSKLMDESNAALLRRLLLTKDNIISIIKYAQYLKQQLADTRTDKQRQEETVVSLELENRTLLSACNNAIQGLELNVHKSVAELRSIHDFSKLDGIISMDLGAIGNDIAEELATDHTKTAEKLLLATRQNEDLNKLFQDAINKLISITEDTQNKLIDTQLTCDEALKEKDQYEEKISKLEADLKEQQYTWDEMKNKLDKYVEKEDEWLKNEAELSTSLSKLHELKDSLLSASQVKSIIDKVDEVEIPDDAFPVGDSHDSASVRKLFYLLDSYNGFLKKVGSLSSENEELQSAIDQQILEIELLKRQVDDNHVDNDKDSEKMNVLLELESGLQNIVRNLDGSNTIDDHKVDGPTSLLPLLDKLVMAKMHESESLKSKNEELGAKLFGTQKVVDDLSNKVKILEDSNQARIVPSEIEQERGISIDSLPTQSEISEIQDMAALGKNNTVAPVQSAAHVRLLRKGSNDHLAINIDSVSERLIDSKEPDDDKGHVFKSLNNSGLIPRQGRTVADRVDGIWVSGSRALMSRPRGRLGLIAYWLVLHIWLLGAIL
ncbi:hypothetical protein CASFOL_006245 [Castilleja foliolosa]|uniref:Uncharacterized protein n=1 Tax=Castilleja foliolosa TaxID=1961234 RepID=A0ABD3E6F2_9LAMI